MSRYALAPFLLVFFCGCASLPGRARHAVPSETFAEFVENEVRHNCDIEADCADWIVYLWKQYCAQNSRAEDIGGGHPDLLFRKDGDYPDRDGNGLPDRPIRMRADVWHYNINASALAGIMEPVPDRDNDGVPALNADGDVDYGDLRPGDVMFFDYHGPGGLETPRDGRVDHTAVIIRVRKTDAQIGYCTYDKFAAHDGNPCTIVWPDEYSYSLPVFCRSLKKYIRKRDFTGADIHSIKKFRGEE